MTALNLITNQKAEISLLTNEKAQYWHAMTRGLWDSLSMTRAAGQCLMAIGTEILCILYLIDE